jgi:hypothetical protein
VASIALSFLALNNRASGHDSGSVVINQHFCAVLPPPSMQVLKRKASAKAQLQAQLGLHVSREEDGGEPWELVVFMGRMTHQKAGEHVFRGVYRGGYPPKGG